MALLFREPRDFGTEWKNLDSDRRQAASAGRVSILDESGK